MSQALALARQSCTHFFQQFGWGQVSSKIHAIWVRFRLSNDQRQLREISHFLIPSWPTSSSRPRKRPSPSRQPVTLAAAAAPPPPPIAVTLAAVVTLAAYLRAACVLPPVPRSINCTKLQLSSFISRIQLFLSVEFLCNYHAIWAQKIEIMQ